MITKIIKNPSKSKEEKAIKKLIEHFNSIAESKKSKYMICIEYAYPHLYKKILFFWREIEQIYYSESIDKFWFCNAIDKKTFKEIKEILEEIPERFEVEIKNGM